MEAATVGNWSAEWEDFYVGSRAFAFDPVAATLRITPSTEPNLSCDILAKQMGVQMPRGPHIVELSRLRANPAPSREERAKTLL